MKASASCSSRISATRRTTRLNVRSLSSTFISIFWMMRKKRNILCSFRRVPLRIPHFLRHFCAALSLCIIAATRRRHADFSRARWMNFFHPTPRMSKSISALGSASSQRSAMRSMKAAPIRQALRHLPRDMDIRSAMWEKCSQSYAAFPSLTICKIHASAEQRLFCA